MHSGNSALEINLLDILQILLLAQGTEIINFDA